MKQITQNTTSVAFVIPPTLSGTNVARDLVYGCWCKGKRIAATSFPPMSLVQIASLVEQGGYPVALIDGTIGGESVESLAHQVAAYDIAVILAGTVTIADDAAFLAEARKINPGLFTIIFGSAPTAETARTLAFESIDVAVRREADYVIRDLVSAVASGDDWRTIKGISYLSKGKVVTNPDYPLIADLDELPIPNRSLLPEGVDYFNPIVKRTPYTTVFTSRGCPFRCSFCTSPSFYGNRFRFRSAEKVVEELVEVARLGYREVFFRDEIFTASRERTMAICNGIIREGLDLTWIASARVDTVDREVLTLMKRAGCHMVRFGVESGDQRRLDAVRKGITIEQTALAFRLTHELGLTTHAHTMVGLPGETARTLAKTRAFIFAIDPTIVTIGIMTPYPGSPLFEEMRPLYPEMADTSQVTLENLHTSTFFNEKFQSLSEEELAAFIRSTYRGFYLRLRYIGGWLKRMRTVDELKRVTMAGAQVLDFVIGGK